MQDANLHRAARRTLAISAGSCGLAGHDRGEEQGGEMFEWESAAAASVRSVAVAPGGIGFAIETKTRNYEHRHLMLLREQAAWLSRRRRRWCRRGALPVVCIVRDRGVQRWEQGALVVSIDQPASTLNNAAGGLSAPIGQR
jgi:hypothetical protein